MTVLACWAGVFSMVYIAIVVLIIVGLIGCLYCAFVENKKLEKENAELRKFKIENEGLFEKLKKVADKYS